MTENDYITELWARWPRKGSLIQLGPENGPHTLDDALASFKRAIVEAWEEIGYFYDFVLDDETAAQTYFREAEKLKAHHID